MPTLSPEDETGLAVSVARPVEDISVLTVDGDLDMLTSPSLADLVHKELARRCRAIVMDLTGVEFMGSSGLAVLVEGRQQAGDATKLVFAGSLHRSVERSLEMTGLCGIFETYPTVEDAIAALR